jgi:hypothetical protein
VSTARGGEPGAFEPGLEHLIGALTASGHPHELVGREAARAAFRAASQQPAPASRGRSASARSRSPWSAWRRRPVLITLPARIAAGAAVVVAVFGGFTAAAAEQALPAPVQRLAYTVLSPLGMPVSQPGRSYGPPSPHRTSPLSSGPAPSQGGGCHCPSPSVTSAGASAAPTYHPKPSTKPATKPTTRPATKPTAVRPVLKLFAGLRKDRLIVYGRSGGRIGDLVNLNEWTGSGWSIVASEPLVLGPKGGHRAVFILPAKTAAGQLFQADVLEGASHTPVASNRLRVPRLPGTGAKAVQPSPTATTTASGTPSPTPSVTSSASPTAISTGTGGATPTPTPDPTGSPTSSGTPAVAITDPVPKVFTIFCRPS